jgi:hypothetical protein
MWGLLLTVAVSACSTGPSAVESKERQAKAQAMFAQRCQAAGEKIHRTVDGVEGIYLMKLRPQGINFGNQFTLDDPYGSDLSGDGYIETFVRGSFQASSRDIPLGAPPRLGYHYVEAIDPKDGKRYRYTGSVREHEVVASMLVGGDGKVFKTADFLLDKVLVAGAAPRYGVTYDDISTRGEREYWIAGSSLRVVDLQTNEVIAERVGYMYDWAQGSQAGQRSPWLFAANNACPVFGRDFKGPKIGSGHAFTLQAHQTQDFVEKVLIPKPWLGRFECQRI